VVVAVTEVVFAVTTPTPLSKGEKNKPSFLIKDKEKYLTNRGISLK
jgi:hypothetical protein